MIFLIIALAAAVIGALVAQSKGKSVVLWAVLCGLFPIALLVLAFMSNENDEAPTAALPEKTAAVDEPFWEKWQVLKSVDNDIREVGETLSRHGLKYEKRLAQEFFLLNDKSYLGPLRDKIMIDVEKDVEFAKYNLDGEQADRVLSNYRDIFSFERYIIVTLKDWSVVVFDDNGVTEYVSAEKFRSAIRAPNALWIPVEDPGEKRRIAKLLQDWESRRV